MTYTDAAAALRMTPESLRQRARREHWRKTLGNDGRALVMLPVDADRSPPGDTPGDTGDDAPASRPTKRTEPDTASVLQARIAEMEHRAVELRADLSRERAERSQERERAERLVGEVADLARQLARVAEDAGARERGLHDRVAIAEAALAATHNRPWWRRLVG